MSARKKLKSVPTKVMRGYKDTNGWLLLTSTGRGKRWTCSVSTPTTCVYSLFMYYLSAVVNNGTVRIVAPGGIIAAEHSPRARMPNGLGKLAKRTQRKPKSTLKTTEQLISPMSAPRSSLLDHPGYPHQTTPAKPKD